MPRLPLALALSALQLAACQLDGTAPTVPSAARGAESAIPAARGVALPFRGTVDAVENARFDPATGRVEIYVVGGGTAAHLGRYTLVSDISVDPNTGAGVGSLTLTAANGATLSATVTTQGTPSNGVVTIVENATITGGTGRFAGAAGRFTIERTLTQATGLSVGSFAGVLSRGA